MLNIMVMGNKFKDTDELKKIENLLYQNYTVLAWQQIYSPSSSQTALSFVIDNPSLIGGSFNSIQNATYASPPSRTTALVENYYLKRTNLVYSLTITNNNNQNQNNISFYTAYNIILYTYIIEQEQFNTTGIDQVYIII